MNKNVKLRKTDLHYISIIIIIIVHDEQGEVEGSVMKVLYLMIGVFMKLSPRV